MGGSSIGDNDTGYKTGERLEDGKRSLKKSGKGSRRFLQ